MLMKTNVIQSSVARILSGLSLIAGLAFSNAGLAQTCPLPIAAPNNTASIYLAAWPAWWNSPHDFSAADNPALLTDYIYSDTAGLPAGPYLAWCIDIFDDINGNGGNYTATLYSTCDTNIDQELPNNYPGSVYVSPAAWHQINYILNHKNGAYFYNIQLAIWNLIGGPILPEALVGPAGGYPSFDTNIVNNILTDASNNAAAWQPQCGDVIAVVVAINASPLAQLTIIEVPYPCTESISVSKQVACSLPGNDCTVFGSTSAGFAGTNDPAFCYQITVANTGTIPLTNLTVSDTLLGNLSAQFVSYPNTGYSPTNATNVLLPGGSVTAYYKMPVHSSVTNIVTVVADASLANPVTNSTSTPPTIIANATPVTATSQAVAYISPASVFCNLSVTSSQDLNSPPISGTVLLPSSTSQTPTVNFSITVINTGSATLSNLTVTSPYLTGLGCVMPAPFSLAPGASNVVQLCSEQIPCAGISGFTVSVSGLAGTDAGHCAVYDMNGNPIGVYCSSLGSVSYLGNVSGNVYLDCDGHTPVLGADKPLAGVTVALLTNSSPNPTQVNSTTTDVNGYYTFLNVPPGNYLVQATPPANYTQTFPANGQVMAVTCNSSQNFGLEDNTPVTLNIHPGISYGCNPTSATLAQARFLISNSVTAADDRGPVSFTVTDLATTNGCLVQDVFTIFATGTCGQTAIAKATNTWTTETSAPTILGVPTTGLALGCNPNSIPTVASLKALVTAKNTCSTPTVSVTSTNTTNGCVITDTFTITATDSCSGNSSVAKIAYTWTVETSAPTILGVPTTGLSLGCNPAANSLPTVTSIKGLVSATNTCSTPTVSVTSTNTTNGCYITNTFTITATDSCSGNSSVAKVAYYWTVETTAPTITGMPTTGLYLGCNPASGALPTVASITALVKATNTCSTPSLSVTSTNSTNGCYITNTFTVTATDSCSGNSSVAKVAYYWTVETSAPTITGVPTTGLNLGVNPASNTLPTAASITALVKATNSCSTPTVVVTSTNTTNGCIITDTFTITATDACSGNRTVATVAYTWTVDTIVPTLTGVPAGGYLGTNPPVVPTDLSVSNMLHTTDACCAVTLNVSHLDATNGCTITRTFTITATDACSGNHVTAPVVYSWTTDTGLIVVCPPNVTIATNFAPIYCSFSRGDWCSPCNGSNSTPTWWVNWDQQNHGYNCLISWTNWWTACNGYNPGSNFWNFCSNQTSGNPSGGYWWGGAQNQNWAPSWCASFNYGNPNTNWWVPCNGFNPGSVLTNCFGAIYSNGCVQIGLTNGYCVKLTSPNSIRQCLGFSGSPGVLTSCATNPATCGAGSFFSEVLALQLNCDFGQSGEKTGFGGDCGDLVLNDSTSPCNGWKVREVLKTANCVLGGGSAPSGCTATYLCGLCSNLNQSFEGCQVSGWCRTHLTPVYIPPPSVTGTATVTTGACVTNVCLTHCDSIAAGSCAGIYIITRTWLAVDAAGMSNSCQQTITITPFPGPSISGTVINDDDGTGCASGSSYSTNRYWSGGWGWNGWSWNTGSSTPDFSNETGLAGATVTLTNSKGAVVATTLTDTNGNFIFANPGAGTYTVIVTSPAGFTLTYPTNGTTNRVAVTITNSCQVVCNLLFAYTGNQAAVKLIKTGPTNAACGSNITYTFAVTNTGNNCCDLTVIDPLLGGQIFCQNAVPSGQGFTFTKTYTLVKTNIGLLTNTAWAVANPSIGPNVTNYSSAVTTVTTQPQTSSIYCNFNSQMPGSGWVWCNSHISANPGCQTDIHCQGASITITGLSGKTYTFPVPDCDVIFTNNCTTASNSFDGTKWKTILPTSGDDEIFLAGCAIPANPDYANVRNVLWQGTFTSSTPGTSFNWQWAAACYNNTAPSYSSIGVKASHQTPCGYSSSDHAGTPENQKPYCVGGGTGGGGSNWTGSWSSSGYCAPPSCN